MPEPAMHHRLRDGLAGFTWGKFFGPPVIAKEIPGTNNRKVIQYGMRHPSFGPWRQMIVALH